ncbi:MAG: hypothetical protein ACLP59_29510 [Bryobacteraceae bacterium]
MRALAEELAGEGPAFGLVVEGPARDLHPILRGEAYRIAHQALLDIWSGAGSGTEIDLSPVSIAYSKW